MLRYCYSLGGGEGQGTGSKKPFSCLKVSPTGFAIVPGSSVRSLAFGCSIEGSSAAKG